MNELPTKNIKKKKKFKRKLLIWVRKWISRRNRLGASETLLKELALEDKVAYNNHLIIFF